jgi:hypothetical protein
VWPLGPRASGSGHQCSSQPTVFWGVSGWNLSFGLRRRDVSWRMAMWADSGMCDQMPRL